MTLIYLAIMAVLCIRITIAVYRRFWDYGLDAEVLFSQHEVEEGGRLYLREKVENRKWLPLPTLMVKFGMDRNILCVGASHTSVTDRQYRNDWVAVMPYKRVTRSIEIIGTKRGYYNIEEVRLVTTDILFRERLNKTISNDTELYVYPSRSQFMRLPEIFCQMYGESLLNRQLQEDSMEFMGIRDYVQTDSMRKINWKATARTGSLKVNQYHDSTSQRLTILLNVSQTGILRYYDLIEEFDVHHEINSFENINNLNKKEMHFALNTIWNRLSFDNYHDAFEVKMVFDDFLNNFQSRHSYRKDVLFNEFNLIPNHTKKDKLILDLIKKENLKDNLLHGEDEDILFDADEYCINNPELTLKFVSADQDFLKAIDILRDVLCIKESINLLEFSNN